MTMKKYIKYVVLLLCFGIFTVNVADDNCPITGLQIYSFCITVNAVLDSFSKFLFDNGYAFLLPDHDIKGKIRRLKFTTKN